MTNVLWIKASAKCPKCECKCKCIALISSKSRRVATLGPTGASAPMIDSWPTLSEVKIRQLKFKEQKKIPYYNVIQMCENYFVSIKYQYVTIITEILFLLFFI